MSHILVVGGGPATAEEPVHLRARRSTAAPWRIVAPRVGGFPFTPFDALLTEVGLVDCVQRETRDDTRAIFVDTFGEYGIDAMRSAVDVPVIGAAEAALAVAAAHGPRFGIVTVWPASLQWLYERQLRRLAVADRCIGVRYVGAGHADADTPGITLDAMRSGSPAWLQRIVAAAESLADAGAHSVVFGCTCMAPLHAAVATRCRIPVVCAAHAGANAVRDHVDGRRVTGTAAVHPPSASDESRRRFAAWMDQRTMLPSDSGAGMDCPVCITAPD